ncbi:hypothetical protein ABZP36_011780 [Zizania latifolia]
MGDVHETGEDILFNDHRKLDIPEFADYCSEEESEEVDRNLMVIEHDVATGQVEENILQKELVHTTDKGKKLIDENLRLAIIPCGNQSMTARLDPGPSRLLKLIEDKQEDKEMNAEIGDQMVKKNIKKRREPPVAVHQSSRIRRDGVPIQVKAQQRADLLF